MKSLLTFISFLFIIQVSFSQEKTKLGDKLLVQYKKGIGFTTPDSLFSLNFRFRMQNRVGYISKSEVDLTPEEFDFRVRRLRLRFDGFMFTPRLMYNIQLSFSRADMDWDVSGVPNVIRDAAISYYAGKGFTIGIGQTKLPGNRQRVVSSGELQFADRSIVNNALTLDRDFGMFFSYAHTFKNNFNIKLKTAISTGEGRNVLKSDRGLGYTARLELLPLGEFTDKGDYFEGDLVHEPKPKLAICGGFHFNDRAMRTGGQLGKELYAPRAIYWYEADMVFKYKGIALSSEFIRRTSDSAMTLNDKNDKRYIYIGNGINTQLSYCTKKMWEVALRHSLLVPGKDIRKYETQKSEYGICLSKYIMKHRLKVQTDLTYRRDRDMLANANKHNSFQFRFQIELGI